jgi:hypothetical protein
VDLAAERDALVDQRHRQAGGGRLRGRREPGGATTDDTDVSRVAWGRQGLQGGNPGNVGTLKSFL